MNRFLEVLRKSLHISFQATLNETAYQIPAGFPVLAAVAVDLLVNGKTTVELEIENSLRLFCSQIQLTNQRSHILILRLLCDLLDYMGRQGIVEEYYTVFRMGVDFVTDPIGAFVMLRRQGALLRFLGRFFPKRFFLQFFQNRPEVAVVQIECTPVDSSNFA